MAGGPGELLLTPGVYIVAVSGRVSFRDAGRVTVGVVLAGDVRFRGPRATVDHDHGALAADERIDRIDAPVTRGRRDAVAWDRAVCRPFAAFKLVRVPDAAGPVPVSVWGSAEPLAGPDYRPRVEFNDVELLAAAVGAGATTPDGAKGGGR
ncbi:MAG: hypothetical protein K2P78_03070 [Gemmataceae bacterium]|nr:hypothetical protein [Gemmataceae bacterium]